MGRTLLICRLAVRDLRHRPVQAVLALLAITAATAVLTLGLILHGVTGNPYAATKAATRGPDVVAQLANLKAVTALDGNPAVADHSGPYPVAGAVLRVHGVTATAEAEGRELSPAAVDQPDVTQGSWIRPGEVVLERTFAGALGAGVGDRVTLNGRSFTVAGIAVTAASPPYPNMCYTRCDFILPAGENGTAGLLWLTEPDARGLATADAPRLTGPGAGGPATAAAPLTYQLNLTLRNPADAPALANAYDSSTAANAPYLVTWESIASADGLLVADEQTVLKTGSWLITLLALASVAVLAGGRMAEQTRRVGLLKAVGGTPGMVAAVLLAEHVALALAAAAAGLAVGWLTAPLLSSPGPGLIGAASAPALTGTVIATVVAVALAVALVSTLVPAVRASLTSTVSALADAARAPRRRPLLIAASRRLPVPLLIGLRLVARRLRRAMLTAASTAMTVTGIAAVLAFHDLTGERSSGGGIGNPVDQWDIRAIWILTVVLGTLAVVNAIFTAWVTTLDARHSSAVARAFGATPGQLTAGVSAAQLLPALPGALLGIPLGIGLFAATNGAGTLVVPPASWLAIAVLGPLVAVAALTAIPARIGARQPVAAVLQAEMA
jgi:ABC-type lipoprotein release transport system permease subunit